jgi:hypothetical protein
MPNAGEILNGLSAIANSWQPLAFFWHVYFGAFAASLLLASHLSKRLAGALLVPPIVSVSVLAWIDGNPFNGTAFALLSVVLALLAFRLKATPVKAASATWLAVGAFLFAFGWVYPHFLDAETAATYLYVAPLGLIPCPTLAMAVGVAIIFRGLESPAWSLTLSVAGLFYGVFGAAYLGVTLDWVLAGGALSLLGLLLQQASGDNASAA